MKNLPNLSLRGKQTLIMMLTSSVVLLLACTALSIYEVVAFRASMVQNLATLADIVVDDTASALDFADAKSAEETLSALHADPTITAARIYTKGGELFAKFETGTNNISPPTLLTDMSSFRAQRLMLTRRMVYKGAVIGTVYLECDMSGLTARVTRYVGIVGVVFLVSVLLALAMSNRLQGLISNPILHLAQVARSVAAEKNYGLRATKRSHDELGDLIDGFNEMLGQIQQRDAALQEGRIELEARVIARTTELANANIALQRENAERTQSEQRLRESEEKFRQLAENISDVFWITSPDLQQVLYVSPAYEKVWGRSSASAREHPKEWTDAILPEDRERVATTFGRLMAGDATISVEFRIARPDGEVRWIHSGGVQVHDAAGKLIRLAGIASDITERKGIEANAFQSQKMETVGKLAGGVAHEFNSILTAIIGHSEVLIAGIPSGSPLAKNASEISKSAGRAATLTRQLLAYGRKQTLQPEILDLDSVLTDMNSNLGLLLGRAVEVVMARGPGVKSVKIDPAQLQQAIMNIATNASESMPNGGKLAFETSIVILDQENIRFFPELQAGEYAMLTITDNGAGMSEKVKTHIFEPFFTTEGVGQSTGLGLSMCYGIVKQSGGHISVESELSRGTTFKIYLPRVECQAKTATRDPGSPDLPRGTETILLVGDDSTFRRLAATLLRQLGYTVVPANSIEVLSLNRPPDIGQVDLLFADVVMPNMSDKEWSARVKELYPNSKILFTIASTEKSMSHQGDLNHDVAFLQKPFTPSALAHKLREVLDQADIPQKTSAV